MMFSHVLQPVPSRDWLIIGLLFIGISLFIAISELVRRRLGWPEEFTRKLVHISVGLLMFFAPALLHTSLPMVLIAAFFTISNYVAMKKGLLKGMHGARQSYGTTFYPLSFLILVLFAWPDHAVIIIASMMVLAIGDAMAAIVGESLSNPHTYILISERKSLEGSLSMFFSSAIVLFLILQFYPYESTFVVNDAGVALWIALVTAAVATGAEALSHRGSDNLTVPLFTALILYFMLNHTGAENLQLTLGTILGALVAYLSYRVRFLTASGAVATFLLATIIFGFGGWKWSIPILTFFMLSSIISKMGKSRKEAFNLIFEKSSQRDYAQVLANGGMAGLWMTLHMFYQKPQFYLLYLASLAAAMADTWATEIGTFSRQSPRLIKNFKIVEPGTSGGITLLGSAGALLGAFLLTLSGWSFLRDEALLAGGMVFAAIIFSGFAGSMVDSWLGATVQAQYRCPICGKITERVQHCQHQPTRKINGWKWMTNDVVNFFNTASAPVILWILLTLF